MQYKAKSEKELNEQSLLQRGEYDFEIQAAVDAVSGPNSKTPGTEMIKLTLSVYAENGRKQFVRDILHPAMEVKLRHFADCVGILDRYEREDPFIADELVGKTGRVKIKIVDKDDGYPAKNEVADYVPKNKQSAAAIRGGPDSEESPF
jgi:hypothetical protein